MKKNKICLILSICLVQSIIFTGCQSSKAVETDEYITENEKATELSTKKVTGTNAKKSNFWDSFWGKDKYTEIGDMTVNTTNALFALENKEGIIAVQNKANTIGFGSGYMAAYYYVTFDDDSRHKLINDINKYFNDFEEKKLDRNDEKSLKKYGTIKARLDWGAFKASTPNYGFAVANSGYRFKGKSPYFTLTIYATANQKFLKGDDSGDVQSINLSYYFTKAQAKALADQLSDESISEKLSMFQEPEINDEGDEY